MVLICISLMTNVVEHLFTCLFFICVSFLKCLFRSFVCVFLLGCSFCYYWFGKSFKNIDTSPLSELFYRCFFLVCVCLFIYLTMYCKEQVFNFNEVQLISFFQCSHYVLSKKFLPDPEHKDFLPCILFFFFNDWVSFPLISDFLPY